jgi:hypothetical protein
VKFLANQLFPGLSLVQSTFKIRRPALVRARLLLAIGKSVVLEQQVLQFIGGFEYRGNKAYPAQ